MLLRLEGAQEPSEAQEAARFTQNLEAVKVYRKKRKYLGYIPLVAPPTVRLTGSV